jgi:hypothetical protein
MRTDRTRHTRHFERQALLVVRRIHVHLLDTDLPMFRWADQADRWQWARRAIGLHIDVCTDLNVLVGWPPCLMFNGLALSQGDCAEL